MEGCRSGLTGDPGKIVCQQWHREFESRPFRQCGKYMHQTEKLLPRWFHVWFYISTLVFFAGGIVNRLTGVPDEGLNLWGAAIGVFAMYLLTLFMWRWKEALQLFIAKISLPLAVKSVL